ncbi:MAG: hypothetical protein S4CHLAM123_01370 [Chlamydiales bacterium]|nr:hypothetical protein [Chlamydiales bacterium]
MDDGNFQKTIIDYILRQQEPFLHMPERIEEKYLEDGVEKLLKSADLTYDQWGHVIEEKIYDADDLYAYSILKEYDEQRNLLSETNPIGQKRTFTYDDKGRCLEETSFSQKLKEKMRYDTQGRLLEYEVCGADGTLHTTTYKYDFNGNLTQEIDAYQNVLSYKYDPLTQKVIKTDFPSIATNDGQVLTVFTSSTYDFIGREVSKTSANGYTTSCQCNAYGSPVEIHYPNGSKEFYRYTKNGNIASHTDREGLTTTFTYDVLDRVLSKQYNYGLGEEKYKKKNVGERFIMSMITWGDLKLSLKKILGHILNEIRLDVCLKRIKQMRMANFFTRSAIATMKMEI